MTTQAQFSPEEIESMREEYTFTHGHAPGTKQKSKQKSSDRKNDWTIMTETVAHWKKPLAFHSGDFWSFSPENGWTICTNSLHNLASKLRGRNTRHSVVPMLEAALSTPDHSYCSGTYYERVGKPDQPEWIECELNYNQALFSDGILSLSTGDFLPLGGRVIFGPMISLPYCVDGDEPRCKEFEEMIHKALPDPETCRHFQEVVSCILQPHMILRGQIVMWGTPFSGKTTLATAIGCCPAGRTGISQIQEEELVRDKFITAALTNRFVNVSDDSAITPRWVNFLKRYTSGSMTVEPKFHMPTTVTPTAKLITTCNEMQNLLDASGAATDRLYAFKFQHALEKIYGSNKDIKMTVEYWSKRERRQGILTWLLEGLERLRERDRFSPPQAWLDDQERAKHEADPIAAALVGTFERSAPDSFISSKDVMIALEETSLNIAATVQVLPRYLSRLFDAKKVTQKVDGILVRGYTGIQGITG